MSSFGRLQAALVSGTQETTLALLNANIDLSLFKVEAPTEYKDLGKALSKKRKTAAEYGDPHRTARKLGTLFDGIVPTTPNLIKAYGLRASEIAQSPLVNIKAGKFYGPFTEYVGADATNIWAAATSGESSVGVHLLACILARIWSASEAVGIWEQIISTRKEELAQLDEHSSVSIQALAASQIHISRNQIAEWDASARAWLRTADEVNQLKQKQLALIAENLDIPVNGRMDVYASVIETWRSTMMTVDKIIGGMGHSVQDGAVLLALLSWHLYPDMVVLGRRNVEIHQKDPLIATGGCVTIGLFGLEKEFRRGVHWSLPLAYVRFYGDPVHSEGSIRPDTSRVSMDQFMFVALGSLFRCWGIGSAGVDEALTLVADAWDLCHTSLKKRHSEPGYRPNPFLWLKLLAEAVERYRRARAAELESCQRLIALGMRQAVILARLVSPVPPFSLHPNAFIKILRGMETKIRFLRTVAKFSGAEPDTLIIRIRKNPGSSTDSPEYHYISAAAMSNPVGITEHKHWVDARHIDAADTNPEYNDQSHLEALPRNAIEYLPDTSWFRWYDPPSFFKNPPLANEPDQLETKEIAQPVARPSLWNMLWGGQNTAQPADQPRDSQKGKRVLTFQPVYGDPEGAAIFRRVDRPDVVLPGLNPGIIARIFRQPDIDPMAFFEHIASLRSGSIIPEIGIQDPRYPPADPEEAIVTSLQVAATAAMIYEKFGSATIALDVIRCGPLYHAQWAYAAITEVEKNGQSDLPFEEGGTLLPWPISRRATFSCIGFFESGGFQIRPDFLKNVMALSAGNSIYVAAPLICDPSINPDSHDVRRILGNIGRSGLAFLFPPAAPKLKGWDVSSFQVVRHDMFDGQALDCFQNTSLHLQFSGYESPIDVGSHGGRYTEAFFLESIVSVHDRGEWIADLDVLGTFDSPRFHCLVEQQTCKSTPASKNPRLRLVAIDSWKELLDKPADVAVVRAHGNWLGRLAAAAVSVSLGLHTVVFSGEGCWECGEKVLEMVPMPLTDGVPSYPVFIL